MGPIGETFFLWFQFLALKVISNNSTDFGVSMFRTGEKPMGASIHDALKHANYM